MYDFNDKYAQIYIKYCKNCGTAIEVSTQKDQGPEFYMDIYIKCFKCKTSVHFSLPVN